MIRLNTSLPKIKLNSTGYNITFGNVILKEIAGDIFVTPPEHYNSTGTQNQIAIDDDYLYVCVSTNRWKRFLGFTNF